MTARTRDPLEVPEVEKAIAQVQGAVQTLLADHLPEAEAKRIAETLSTGTWTHDHPLDAEVARWVKSREG